MKHSSSLFAVAIAVAAAAAACVGYETKTTTPSSPTGAGIDAVVGTWKSVSTGVIPSPSSCTDFTWTPTQQSPTTAVGAFTATCAGGLKVSGTAGGSLTGTTITWSATAIASTPEISSCPVTLNGTAELGVSSIRVPYSGTTCLGPVSGVEILNRK